jgi:putative heme-binding domain-containing protein
MLPAGTLNSRVHLRVLLLCVLCFAFAPLLRAEDPLPQLTQILAGSDDPQFQLDVLRGISAALKGRRSMAMPAGWERVESKLASSANPEVRTLAQSLSLTFGSRNALEALRRTAADPSTDAGSRRAALDSLLAVRAPDLVELLQKLVADSALQNPAIRALAAYEDNRTPAAILAAYPRLDSEGRRDALNTLASRAAFAKPLVTALAEGKIARADLTADLVRQLRNLKDPAINPQLDQMWGVMKETSADQKKEIERYTRLYWAGGSQPGDGPRGRVVYNKICAQCHTLYDVGGKVGPDITGANRSDLNYLLETILFPNAVIPNDYRASLIETKDDRLITGLVKEQNANAVVVQTANEVLTLPKNEVKKIDVSEISMMPEGLLANLTDQEVRDLLYYLGRPGQVNLPPEAK